jgi:hypothetical protein
MSQSPPPRRESQVRHRRESFWQITLPMLAAVLVMGLAFALVVMAGPAGISGVADVSLALLSIPLLLLCLVPLALVIGLLVGVIYLLRTTPRYTEVAQDYSARAAQIVDSAMKRVTDAIIPAIVGFQMTRWFIRGGKSGGSDGSSSDDTPAP